MRTATRTEKKAAPASIPLGARVRFARHIERVEATHSRAHHWAVVPDTPGEGVFVGYRHKQNGSWDADDSEGFGGAAYYWCERSRVKVALVVMDPWQDPWTVDPEGLEVVS